MRPWSFAHEGHGQDVVLLMVDFLPLFGSCFCYRYRAYHD
jgi:hypothetical protein